MTNSTTTKTANAYNLKGHECTIKVGDKVRAWDFEPMPGREDAYVEGLFTGWTEDGRLLISVEEDTLYPKNARIEIATPATAIFGEWNGRLTKLDHIKYWITKATGTLAMQDGCFHMLMGSPIVPSDLDLENIIGIGEKEGASFTIELNNGNSVIFTDVKNLIDFMTNWESLSNTK